MIGRIKERPKYHVEIDEIKQMKQCSVCDSSAIVIDYHRTRLLPWNGLCLECAHTTDSHYSPDGALDFWNLKELNDRLGEC